MRASQYGAVSWFLLGVAATVTFSAPLYASPAEIVSIDGKGEFREARQTTWQPAKVKQMVVASQFVRTGDSSKMALLFADKTPVRLGPNSMFQVEDPGQGAGGQTKIDLKQGRVWMHTKSAAGGVTVKTPTALAAIRGTDWEIRVDADGATTLTVVSGEVAFSNEAGQVSVGANEQAVAVQGKAPTKTRLVRAAERIQWVSSFTLDAARVDLQLSGADDATRARLKPAVDAIVGGRVADAREMLTTLIGSTNTDSVPARLLLADCHVYDGELLMADAVLARAPQNDLRLTAARAQIALRRGDIKGAQALLAATESLPLPRPFQTLELALARGDTATLAGDAHTARAAYATAATLAPDDVRAWLGTAEVEAERGEFDAARRALVRAAAATRARTPADVDGRIAETETAAGAYMNAQTAINRALAAEPGNVATRTGYGLLLLQEGRNQAALDELLKATIIEPRAARARLYLAVAYYRLGRFDATRDALAQAKLLDPNDPLPYFIESVVLTDDWRAGEATSAAAAALTRLPNLRSLNGFATTNAGSPI